MYYKYNTNIIQIYKQQIYIEIIIFFIVFKIITNVISIINKN